jgi:hypothetical protein
MGIVKTLRNHSVLEQGRQRLCRDVPELPGCMAHGDTQEVSVAEYPGSHVRLD